MNHVPVPTKLLADRYYILLVEDKFENLLETAVERCLERYGVSKTNIQWTLAGNKADAFTFLDQMDKCGGGGRGFDAILCDLEIPSDTGPNSDKNTSHGLDVALRARTFGWTTAVIGVSAWANDDIVLKRKLAEFNNLSEPLDQPVFDEFLLKGDMGSVGEVKLRRWLIPTQRFAVIARTEWDPPVYFGRSMSHTLHRLIQIAGQDVVGWPLPKILLLGDPSSGKGISTWSYLKLLKEFDKAARRDGSRRGQRPHVVNCASLVSEGESGRIRLFGYRSNSRNISLPSAPGVFERATTYRTAKVEGGFAPEQDEPDYNAGGVVFLDEFVTMPEDLQAAVLNGLEEGVIQRQDGTEVRIGCHVVFATNATPDDLKRGVRRDLLDRIPHVLFLPPLRDRPDEIIPLLTHFAEHRSRELARSTGRLPPPALKVTVTASAEQLIKQAVQLRLITSIRQLQVIANVLDGETIISDGNISPLLEKMRILGIPQVALAATAKELSISNKARVLQLPSELRSDSLPLLTQAAIDCLYNVLANEGDYPNKVLPSTKEGSETKRRVYFILTFCHSSMAKTLTGQNSNAIRAQRFRLAHGAGVNTEDEAQVLNYLLDQSISENTESQ